MILPRITFSMPEEVLLILDTQRGNVSRSKALRKILCYIVAHNYLGTIIESGQEKTKS